MEGRGDPKSWGSIRPAPARELSVPIAILFIVRTALEDRALKRELPGYGAYAQRTPYRLVPGVW